jgi:uncharacterized protein (DUF58 family)
VTAVAWVFFVAGITAVILGLVASAGGGFPGRPTAYGTFGGWWWFAAAVFAVFAVFMGETWRIQARRDRQRAETGER